MVVDDEVRDLVVAELRALKAASLRQQNKVRLFRKPRDDSALLLRKTSAPFRNSYMYFAGLSSASRQHF